MGDGWLVCGASRNPAQRLERAGGSVVGVAHRATDAAAAASSVRVWWSFVVRGLNGRLGRWDVAAA